MTNCKRPVVPPLRRRRAIVVIAVQYRMRHKSREADETGFRLGLSLLKIFPVRVFRSDFDGGTDWETQFHQPKGNEMARRQMQAEPQSCKLLESTGNISHLFQQNHPKTSVPVGLLALAPRLRKLFRQPLLPLGCFRERPEKRVGGSGALHAYALIASGRCRRVAACFEGEVRVSLDHAS